MRRRLFLVSLAPLLSGCLSTALPSTADDAEVRALGESYRTDDDVHIVIEDVVVADHLQSTGASMAATFDHLFLFVSIRVTNTADAPRTLPSVDTFRLLTDAEHNTPHADSGQYTEPVYGEPYTGMADARADVEASGYLVFRIPRRRTTMELSFYDRTAERDIRWQFDPSAAIGEYPILALKSMQAPERSAVGDPIEIGLTVSNDGDATGSIDGTVWTAGALRDERPWSLEVPAKTPTSTTVAFTPSDAGTLHVTVDPFDATERIIIE